MASFLLLFVFACLCTQITNALHLNANLKTLLDKNEKRVVSKDEIHNNKNNAINNEINDINNDLTDSKLLNQFKIVSNTIIRTKASQAIGAKYINESELTSNEACLQWCLEESECNLAVFEEKDNGKCYLFDCGSKQNFLCRFTKHNFYTSSLLKSRTNLTKDLNKLELRNENDLIDLGKARMQSIEKGQPEAEEKRPAVGQPRTVLRSVNVAFEHNTTKSNHCQHYQFACRFSQECIAIYNVCDGIPQCPDGSDEAADLQCPPDAAIVSTNQKMDSSKVPETESMKLGPVNPAIFNYPRLPDLVRMEALLQKQQTPQNSNFPGAKSRVDVPWLSSVPVPTYSNDAFNLAFLQNMHPSDGTKDSPFWLSGDVSEQRRRWLENFAQQQYIQGLLQQSAQQNLPWRDANVNQWNDLHSPDSVKTSISPFSDEKKTVSSSKSKALKEIINNDGQNKVKDNIAIFDFDKPRPLNSLINKKVLTPKQVKQESGSAMIALLLGMFVTALLLLVVAYRMKTIKRKIYRRGGRNLGFEADFLVNGMYL